jgi:hypothetical protein
MSIAQAQAMKKARLDIEELQRQVAALTARFRDLDDLLLMGQKADPHLIYNITPDDVGPPIFRPDAIVSANIASPPKKRGRPPKA